MEKKHVKYLVDRAKKNMIRQSFVGQTNLCIAKEKKICWNNCWKFVEII